MSLCGIKVIRVQTPHGDPPGVLSAPDISSDGLGRIHVFWPLEEEPPPEGRPDPRLLAHDVFAADRWSETTPLTALLSRIRAFRVSQGDGGSLDLIVEESEVPWPAYHEATIHARVLGTDSEIFSAVASDKKAVPSAIGGDGLSVVRGLDGSLHVFWLDWREDYFLVSLLTGEGQVPKVWHRSYADGQWSKAFRVARRGRFDVTSFDSFVSPEKGVGLVWAEGHPGRKGHPESEVWWRSFTGERAQESVRVDSRLKKQRLPGMIFNVRAAVDRNRRVHVAWIRSWWSSRSKEMHSIEVTSYWNGTWSEPTTVSETGGALEWAVGPGGLRGLVFQEGAPKTIFGLQAGTACSLFFAPLTGSGIGPKELISDESLVREFDATTSGDAIHIAFVDSPELPKRRLIHATLGERCSAPPSAAERK